ncbi:MAG: GNAT family N-acetyltransferase [Candidatus Kapabacteria bacterium]|jgi:hypothetical protein|nr:GNAT family N-acetyltransferase [Candidatus Kapabacteria bacterium]
MHYTVQRWQEATFSSAEWDKFVLSADNGTIFHERTFLNYHPPERFTDHSLVIRSKGRIQALFPAVEWTIDRDKTLFSHRGASYGGFVYQSVSLDEALGWVQALKHYAREEGFTRILMTLPPMLYAAQPTNYCDFALVSEGFRYQKREMTAVFAVPPTEDEIFSRFKQEARTATRKAAKMGVRVEKSHDYAAYYDILSHNLMMRHGATPTHTLAELEYLAKTFPDRISLQAAFLEKRMIAGVVNFIANPRTMLGFYISDNKEFQEYRALNLLFYEIFRECAASGIEWYDFGTFTLNMQPNFGLGKFKETFGARGIFRDTLEIWL